MSRRNSDTESNESGEDELFLHCEKDLKSEVEESLRLPKRPRRLFSLLCGRTLTILFHILFLVVNVVWSTANVRYQLTSASDKGTLYEPEGAPYKQAYTEYKLPLGEKSPFTTFDRDVADEAWHSISMKEGLGWLEVSQEKVDLMDQSSVKFNDGAGYFFGMDVFHQLHCLNYLRKKTILYNHLYPSEGEIEHQQVPPEFHIPHCIDSIRLSLQRHADVTLVSQRWANNWLEPWAVWTNKHTCRNFDAIRDWALKSTPKIAGRLQHPKLGTVVSGRLNLSALPIWEEVHDPTVKTGNMPVCTLPKGEL
ncbi:hypothetical protein PT974_02039 [Cladobotryum mycophilum]|uniref:Cyclochlorotine biosynthesis protein O n=1 Tax=Cladobotryum mycophilum TaxID=491253 RepID=A0ABR0SXB1_9HYPO